MLIFACLGCLALLACGQETGGAADSNQIGNNPPFPQPVHTASLVSEAGAEAVAQAIVDAPNSPENGEGGGTGQAGHPTMPQEAGPSPPSSEPLPNFESTPAPYQVPLEMQDMQPSPEELTSSTFLTHGVGCAIGSLGCLQCNRSVACPVQRWNHS